MFNEIQKQDYLAFEVTNDGNLKRYFVRIAPKETEYGIDLVDMNHQQVVDTLKSLNIRREESRGTLLSLLRGYANWCILNNKTTNENVINQVTPESLGSVETVADNMIGGPDHLNKIFEDALDYDNYENKSKMSELLFRLLFEGITLEEIQSFTKKDINYDTNEIKTIHGMTVKVSDDLARLWKECTTLTFYEKKNGRAEASKKTNVNEYTKLDLVDNKYLFRTTVSNKVNDNDMITLDSLRKIILSVFTALERATIPARNINYSGIFYKLYLLEQDGVEITPEIIAQYFRISHDENTRLAAVTRKWNIDFKDWKIAFGYIGNHKKFYKNHSTSSESLRIMASKINFLQWSIDELVSQNENGTIDFDFALQRGSVWDPLRIY
jgi:hypothetical protein